MKVEMKKIKHSASQSEETNAFVGELWLDDKLAAMCQNSGKGGGTSIHYNNPAMRRTFEAFAKAQDPLPSDGPGYPPLAMNDELLIDLLVGEWIEKKALARYTKKKVLFRLEGDEKDSWRSIPDKRPYDPNLHGSALRRKYGDRLKVILNEYVKEPCVWKPGITGQHKD